MGTFKSLTPRTPVAAVAPNDLKRVWRVFLETDRARPANATGFTSIDAKLIAQECSSGAEVLAVVFRTALLKEMVKQGLLNDWREGNELRDIVFSTAASFPLQDGMESFDPDAFIEQLRSNDV
jgi:hypothetical protein